MLARQVPWQTCWCGGGGGGKAPGALEPLGPGNLGNTRGFLRVARVISAPAAARCTFRPKGSGPVMEGAARPSVLPSCPTCPVSR